MDEQAQQRRQQQPTSTPLYTEVKDPLVTKQQTVAERKQIDEEVKRGYIVRNRGYARYDKDTIRSNDFVYNRFETVMKEHVEQRNGDELENYRKIKEAQEEDETEKDLRTKPLKQLHASRGTRYALDNQDVLQFDIGGTGADWFGMKNGVKYMQAKKGDRSVYREKRRTSTSKAARFFSTIFSWIPGVHRRYDPNDKETQRFNKAVEHNLAEEEREYGKQVTLQNSKGKKIKFKNIRKKEKMGEDTVQKTRYNLGGPNLVNGGDYSMENLEEYVLALGSQWLQPKLDEMVRYLKNNLATLDQMSDIRVMLQGHSRGGTATTLAAMRLNQWIHDNYPEEIAMKVKFDITFHDPVPGKFSRTGIREKADVDTRFSYDSKGRKVEAGSGIKSRYRSLAGQQESTVFYCLRAHMNHFLTPQQINGAKRIIITPFDHIEAGYARDEQEVIKKNLQDNKKKYRRKAYVDPKTMQAYRGSGINELGEGVYIADENHVLVKINSFAEYQGVVKKLRRGLENSQEKRYAVIDAAVEDFFKRREQENPPGGELPDDNNSGDRISVDDE